MRLKMVLTMIMGLTFSFSAMAVSSPDEMLPDHHQEKRAELIGSKLRCLVCQNESIEESNAELAKDLRKVVRQHVAAGESDHQIMEWMVARYGNFIRLKPPFNKLTLLLWGMPFLALIFSGMFIWNLIIRRPSPQTPLDEKEKHRIAELMKDE